MPLEYLGEVTVAPVTSTIREVPTEVVLTLGDGMPRECAVNLDHMQTIAKSKIGALVGTLGPARMAEVRAALLFALGYSR